MYFVINLWNNKLTAFEVHSFKKYCIIIPTKSYFWLIFFHIIQKENSNPSIFVNSLRYQSSLLLDVLKIYKMEGSRLYGILCLESSMSVTENMLILYFFNFLSHKYNLEFKCYVGLSFISVSGHKPSGYPFELMVKIQVLED